MSLSRNHKDNRRRRALSREPAPTRSSTEASEIVLRAKKALRASGHRYPSSCAPVRPPEMSEARRAAPARGKSSRRSSSTTLGSIAALAQRGNTLMDNSSCMSGSSRRKSEGPSPSSSSSGTSPAPVSKEVEVKVQRMKELSQTWRLSTKQVAVDSSNNNTEDHCVKGKRHLTALIRLRSSAARAC
jgi:hypothetical protein